jgi:hypothetical protein
MKREANILNCEIQRPGSIRAARLITAIRRLSIKSKHPKRWQASLVDSLFSIRKQRS